MTRPVPAEVSVALRRTAQEGLANAGKHAPGTTTTVHLAFTPCQVVLTVTDTGCPDGRAPGPLAQTGGGYGIEGLRERAGVDRGDAGGRSPGSRMGGHAQRARGAHVQTQEAQ